MQEPLSQKGAWPPEIFREELAVAKSSLQKGSAASEAATEGRGDFSDAEP